MSQNGIRYSEEFKQQIVDFYQAGSSVTYLSLEYSAVNVTIYKWMKELSNVKVSDTKTMSVKEYEKTDCKTINGKKTNSEEYAFLIIYSLFYYNSIHRHSNLYQNPEN